MIDWIIFSAIVIGCIVLVRKLFKSKKKDTPGMFGGGQIGGGGGF